jgi:transcriptional regulator with XRE-family HTH domain
MKRETLNRRIGRNLKKIIEKRGIVLRRLAKDAGTSPTQLYRIMSGDHDICIGNLLIILYALNEQIMCVDGKIDMVEYQELLKGVPPYGVTR